MARLTASAPEIGLSEREAAARRRQYGPNQLKEGKRTRPVGIFLSQFKDLLILILLACTLLSVAMGEFVEAITIISIVFLNAMLGFLQEYKTERTLEALRNLAAPLCHVYRDGQLSTLPASELVPGDVVLLEAGDRVPADGTLSEAVRLRADESLLTGESKPVGKTAAREPAGGNAGEREDRNRPDRAYMGTLITAGRGRMTVTQTGMRTQMGSIAGMLEGIDEGETPLQARLNHLGKVIAVGCLLICAVVTGIGILRGENPLDMLITGISLAVAAVPEGLPAVVTIALSLSVGRMVRRGAVVRKLHAVETLGCATVICSDKTGTLTENRMTVQMLWTADGPVEVGGGSLERSGSFRREGRVIQPTHDPDLRRLLTIAALCSNAELSDAPEGDGSGRTLGAVGDPTEIALAVAAAKAGISRTGERQYHRLDEIPFDSARKRMSVAFREGEDRLLFVKGALDVLLDRCAYLQQNGRRVPLSPQLRRTIEQAGERMGEQALRVLGCAYRTLEGGILREDCEQDLTFVGMAGMIDPPRPEVEEAVCRCRTAGIRPVMITGDHKTTAMAIARKLKILTEGDRVLTGAELDRMDDRQLERAVGQTAVFARVSPEHKLRIVRALRKNGQIVVMTGDGVNDAPAVKEADIGVAMGIAGTDVTKEASSVVLLDDNFATLVAAVEEGRVIYDNIRKFIRYLLSCNIGEVLVMFLGMTMGLPVPLMPIQILMVNLTTDGLPAIALGLEKPEPRVMSEPPRRATDSIFAHGLLTTILFRGCLIGLSTLGVFVSLLRSSGSLEVARTGAFLALVLAQLIHVFECKTERQNSLRINPFSNLPLLCAVLLSLGVVALAVWHPLLQPIVGTTALGPIEVLRVVGYCMIGPLLSAILFRRGTRT